MALLCLALTPVMSCERRATESAELVASLNAEVEALRRQSIALSGENAALRAQLLGQPAWTSSAQLRRVGGPGGVTPFTRICSRGQALIGFNGRAGGVVDSLSPVCAPLDIATLTAPDGSLVSLETDLGPAGGNGGTEFERLCSAGSHVVGLRGHAGANLDAIEVVCRETRPQNAPEGEAPPETHTTSLPPVGGTGGQSFDRFCPVGWVVMGVSGRYGRYVDSLVVHCGPLDEPSDL